MNTIVKDLANAFGTAEETIKGWFVTILAVTIVLVLSRITPFFEPFGGMITLVKLAVLLGAMHYLIKQCGGTKPVRWMILVLIIGGRSLIISFVGYVVGDTLPFNMVVNSLAAFNARQDIGSREQLIVAEAIRGDRRGRLRSGLKEAPLININKQDGAISFDNTLQQGEVVQLAFNARKTIRGVGYVTVRRLNDGFPGPVAGWVSVDDIDDLGPPPILGLDGHGRPIPKFAKEVKTVTLNTGERWPKNDEPDLVTYDNGDESVTISDRSPNKKSYRRCEQGGCLISTPYNHINGQVGVSFWYEATEDNTQIEITTVRALDQKKGPGGTLVVQNKTR